MVERIRRHPDVALDPFIAHAGLIYDSGGRALLEKIYRQYIDLGRRAGLPFLSLAPTWRANPERLQRSAFAGHRTINRQCVEFLQHIRASYHESGCKIYIGGLLACRGDAYRAAEALSRESARDFHAWQIGELAVAGVDFIKAATLPAHSEALGIADACAARGIPYILSFVINPDSTLLDGMRLSAAIESIDSEVIQPPVCFMVNCVHPANFATAVSRAEESEYTHLKRIWGLQANTSAKSPDELDGLEYVDGTDPVDFARLMLELQREFGLKILGGCCGSDDRHIRAIVELLKN